MKENIGNIISRAISPPCLFHTGSSRSFLRAAVRWHGFCIRLFRKKALSPSDCLCSVCLFSYFSHRHKCSLAATIPRERTTGIN